MQNREESVKQMINIRNSVYDMISGIFDDIDNDIEEFTFTKEEVVMLRASRLRMSMKSLRQETLEKIKHMGKAYEGESDD